MQNKIFILLITCIFFFSISLGSADDLNRYKDENNCKTDVHTYNIWNPILKNNANTSFQDTANENKANTTYNNINNLNTANKSINNFYTVHTSINNLNTTNKSINVLYVNLTKGFAAGSDERFSKISQKTVMCVSASLHKYISKNGNLPNSVLILKYRYSLPEFIYILAKTIENRYNKNNSKIPIKYGVKNPENPNGQTINGTFSLKNFYKYTLRVSRYVEKYNVAPNGVATSLGKMQYQTIIYSFTAILKETKNNNLPKSLKINIKKTNKINRHEPRYERPGKISSKILNDLYEGESLHPYLQETKNCPVNDNIIKSLAINLTKNSKTRLEKAIAIFNWVKNKIEYDYYYDTRYGAKEIIAMKRGNCVDQSHLTVALYRASGIPARYVYGNCTFASGSKNGHTWVQILIGKIWTVGDPTNIRNSLGIVNSWNPDTYTLIGKYAEITF